MIPSNRRLRVYTAQAIVGQVAFDAGGNPSLSFGASGSSNLSWANHQSLSLQPVLQLPRGARIIRAQTLCDNRLDLFGVGNGVAGSQNDLMLVRGFGTFHLSEPPNNTAPVLNQSDCVPIATIGENCDVNLDHLGQQASNVQGSLVSCLYTFTNLAIYGSWPSLASQTIQGIRAAITITVLVD